MMRIAKKKITKLIYANLQWYQALVNFTHFSLEHVKTDDDACCTCFYLNFSSRIQWNHFQISQNQPQGAGGQVHPEKGGVHHV